MADPLTAGGCRHGGSIVTSEGARGFAYGASV